MKGQKSNSNHTCLRRPCGGIVLPSIVCLQPFFTAAVNMTRSGYTSGFDLEREDEKVSLQLIFSVWREIYFTATVFLLLCLLQMLNNGCMICRIEAQRLFQGFTQLKVKFLTQKMLQKQYLQTVL